MHRSRRNLITTAAGLATGMAGCSQGGTETSAPQPKAKVYVSSETLTFEPRGASLYGQIEAEGLEAKSVQKPNSVDTSTGSFSVSGEDTTTINFEPDSLSAISIIADSGRFDLLAKGRIVKRGANEYSGALNDERFTPQNEVPPTTGDRESQPRDSTRIFASQESILFELRGGSISGQVGAEAIEGSNLENTDEIDASSGRFVFQGTNNDRILYTSGSLEALSIIAEEGTFDVFYRGNLIQQNGTVFSRSFSEENTDNLGEESGSVKVIETFESGLSSWQKIKGNEQDKVVISEQRSYSGNRSLRVRNQPSGSGPTAASYPNAGLERYPTHNGSVRAAINFDNADAGRYNMAVEDKSGNRVHVAWNPFNNSFKINSEDKSKSLDIDVKRFVNQWIWIELNLNQQDGMYTARAQNSDGERIAESSIRSTELNSGELGILFHAQGINDVDSSLFVDDIGAFAGFNG